MQSPRKRSKSPGHSDRKQREEPEDSFIETASLVKPLRLSLREDEQQKVQLLEYQSAYKH